METLGIERLSMGEESEYTEETLSCIDCQVEFAFTVGEQEFFTQKGFAKPIRCASCKRAKKKGHRKNCDGSEVGYRGKGGRSVDGGKGGICFANQKGECTRGAECRFSHDDRGGGSGSGGAGGGRGGRGASGNKKTSSIQGQFCSAYKAHERAGNFEQAAAWRHTAAVHGGLDGPPNSGHAQYEHKMMQRAHDAGQLGPIGECLGAGSNPYAGHEAQRAASSVLQQYTIVNGELYLGGKPYLD